MDAYGNSRPGMCQSCATGFILADGCETGLHVIDTAILANERVMVGGVTDNFCGILTLPYGLHHLLSAILLRRWICAMPEIEVLWICARKCVQA